MLLSCGVGSQLLKQKKFIYHLKPPSGNKVLGCLLYKCYEIHYYSDYLQEKKQLTQELSL